MFFYRISKLFLVKIRGKTRSTVTLYFDDPAGPKRGNALPRRSTLLAQAGERRQQIEPGGFLQLQRLFLHHVERRGDRRAAGREGDGVAAGAGASIAMACDIAIASPNASFIQAFSKIGLIPDAGGTWFLAERLGLPRAMALAMLGDKLSAEKAKEWGMIWEVADDCVATALEMAARLATMPTKALISTRALLRDSGQRTLDQQLDAERDAQADLGKTHDYIEGVKAFLEKRPAQFKGE
mgnify:CR=1 FL=1